MEEIVKAATSGDIMHLMAVIVTLLGGAVVFLFHVIVKELRARVTRAEGLTDKMVDTFDGLEKATNTAVAVARDNAEIAKQAADATKIALDELRRK